MADVNTYVLALRNGTETDLNLGLGQDIGGGGHVDQEVWRKRISRQSLLHRDVRFRPIENPEKSSNPLPLVFYSHLFSNRRIKKTYPEQ
jgi:hypothetical protein